MAHENESALTQYRTSQIQTASVDRLVLLLYEGALKASQDCRKAIGENNLEDMGTYGRQLQDIMIGLTDMLNLELAEARTLRDLYLFCWKQAVSAQTQHAPTPLNEIEPVLQNLMDGLRSFLKQQTTLGTPPALPRVESPGATSIHLVG